MESGIPKEYSPHIRHVVYDGMKHMRLKGDMSLKSLQRI